MNFVGNLRRRRGDKGEGGGNPYISTKNMEKSYRKQLLLPKLVENGGKESNFTSTGGTRNAQFFVILKVAAR